MKKVQLTSLETNLAALEKMLALVVLTIVLVTGTAAVAMTVLH